MQHEYQVVTLTPEQNAWLNDLVDTAVELTIQKMDAEEHFDTVAWSVNLEFNIKKAEFIKFVNYVVKRGDWPDVDFDTLITDYTQSKSNPITTP
jgi:hypothetical protein